MRAGRRSGVAGLAAVALAAICGQPAQAATLYAKVTASGSGDCLSWASACTLATALTSAASGDEIWTQSGTYGPITLVSGVKLIGGFDGTETSALESDPSANDTVIDGAGARAVTSEGNDSATVLRGFRIINGDETGNDEGGGGMLVDDSDVVVVQCIFEDNLATWWGAAVAIHGNSAPEFVNCIFRDNGWGDAQDNTNVKPYAGGAVYLHSGAPKFTNCLFHANTAGEGAALANYEIGVATLVNCTVADNDATVGYGGGLHDERATLVVRNSIFWGNTSPTGGSQIWNLPGGTTTSVTYSDVQGGFAGTGNINSDPLFVDPALDDYSLQGSSPCKNAGQNSSLPTDAGDLDWDGNTAETLPLDLAGVKRNIDGTVDMGG